MRRKRCGPERRNHNSLDETKNLRPRPNEVAFGTSKTKAVATAHARCERFCLEKFIETASFAGRRCCFCCRCRFWEWLPEVDLLSSVEEEARVIVSALKTMHLSNPDRTF